MGFKLSLIGIFLLIVLTGCINFPIRDSGPSQDEIEEAQVLLCNSLNNKLGSYEGTVCAQYLLDNFGEELEMIRETQSWILTLTRHSADRKGFLHYYCSSGGSGASYRTNIVLTERENCIGMGFCEQEGNTASCKEADSFDSELIAQLDAGFEDKGGYQIFCEALSNRVGIDPRIEFTSSHGGGAHSYNYNFRFCDPRVEKENILVDLNCGRVTEAYGGYRGYKWVASVSFISCAREGKICAEIEAEFNEDPNVRVPREIDSKCVLDVGGSRICENLNTFDPNLDPADNDWKCCKGTVIQEGDVTCCDGDLISIYGIWSKPVMNSFLNEEVSYRYSADLQGPYFILCTPQEITGECILGGRSVPTGNSNEYRFSGTVEFTEKLLFSAEECTVLVGDEVD